MKRVVVTTVLLVVLASLATTHVKSAGGLTFTDRTQVAGFDLNPDIGGHHGSFIADYDNDGDEDVFMTAHGISQADDTGWNALFRNRGNGVFDEVAGSPRKAGVTGGATPVAGVDLYGRFTHELHGAAWFDYDNDGDFDLYTPDTDSNKSVSGPGRHGYDELYENNGDGSFTRVSTQRGFSQTDLGRRGVVAGDFNRDGFLDLFVLQRIEIYLNPDNPYDWSHVIPSPYRAVYFNQGGNSFCLEGTAGCHPATGVSNLGWSQGVTSLDYDLDGDVDVIEADEFSGTGLLLWENDGNGYFQQVSAARGLPGPGNSVNCIVGGDVDNDGDVDLYTWYDNGSTQVGRLYRNNIRQPGSNAVGPKSFTYVATIGGAEHMFFADLDNDGDLDLVSGGVFLNNGSGSFVQDTTTGLVAQGRGGMAFDADSDGDMDVVMNPSDRTYPYRRFYRNDLANGLKYLKVKLTGRGGQAGAPGAKVYVYQEGFLGDPTRLLGYREVVTATGGFVNAPSPIQHFGLGARTAVDVRAVFATGETVNVPSAPANTLVQIQTDQSQPPVISNVQASASQTTATVTWTTDKVSDSRVKYGTASGSYPNDTGVVQNGVTAHAVNLSNLTAGTTYYYVASSGDGVNPPTTSPELTFQTTAPDTTAPTFSNVAATNVTTSSATITWTTNEASDSQVEYGLTTSYGSLTALNSQVVTAHSAGLTGLSAGTVYHYRVRSKDAAGNQGMSVDFSFTTTATDTTPPVISNVASSNVTSSSATVTWTTNEASDTQVEYGLTTSYGSSTSLNAQLVTSHSSSLSGLTAGTLYHYRVRSKDAAGNLAVSGDATFTTAAAAALLTDNFSLSTLDTTKWVRGTNGGNQASVVSGQLELRSGSSETGWVITKNRFVAQNTTVMVKVTQPNNDGDLGMTPTYTASSVNGIFGGANNWYRFYTYRSGSSGPYLLYAQWKKNGVVGGLDVTGSLVVNGPVYLRLRMDTTKIYFEASLNGTSWVTTYSETFSLPGYTLGSSFYYELAGYNTPTKGVFRVDDFSIK